MDFHTFELDDFEPNKRICQESGKGPVARPECCANAERLG